MDKNKKIKKEPNLLFKKYYILDKIDEGSFGSIYLAKNTLTNEKVAIKVENRNQYKPLLEREAFILFYLRGPGLPEIKTFGKTRDYFILVQTLLGPSLSSLIDNYNIIFTVKDICMLSIQMLERLEYIHSKDYIHRDIKPHNFLMGLKDPNMLYLIDFGLSKKYRSKKGKHIQFSITNNITGTPRYCSINALRGAEQSRRDDLESLFYLLLYFFRGNVPWQNLKIKSRNERFNKINEIKKTVNYKLLCKNLPEEFYAFGIYIKSLKFEQEPNYKYMQKLFYSILAKIKEINDDAFSWINKDINKINKNYHSHRNIFREKTSVHKRLYNKISYSLEKKHSQYKDDNMKNQGVSIKDNITLASLNIDNNNNPKKSKEIKKASSYAGASDIRVRNIMNKKNKNELLVNKKSNINNRNYNLKNNEKKNHYNKGIIKRNPTAIKTNKISNILDENYGNIQNNDFNQFNNNNESIKNLFLRNNRILYTSPNLLLDIKKLEHSSPNYNSKINPIKNFINRTKSQYSQKIINRNYLIRRAYYSNYNTNISNFSNSKDIILRKNNILKGLNKSKNSSCMNITNSNISSINNSNNNTSSSKYNNINYLNTYNTSIVNTNINLDKRENYNKVKTNSIGFTKRHIRQNTINFTPESTIRKKNNNKVKILQEGNINLNIKLINNNNYNSVPLMIYNTQFNKINNINSNINKKNVKLTNRNNKMNNNKNYNNRIPNEIKNNNVNRVIKYKLMRKSKIINNKNNINNEEFIPVGDEFHNKIKIMNMPKHKAQLDKNVI